MPALFVKLGNWSKQADACLALLREAIGMVWSTQGWDVQVFYPPIPSKWQGVNNSGVASHDTQRRGTSALTDPSPIPKE